MADAVGARNIWDCLGRLKPKGSESPKTEDARATFSEEDASEKCEHSPGVALTQQSRFDASGSYVSDSSKPMKRRSLPLLASMQKKLKISHLNFQQKPGGTLIDKEVVDHEIPLDLSTKSDDGASTRVTESPLDLSLKKEAEIFLPYTVFQPICVGGFKAEETLCITNHANQSGGSVSISKQFPTVTCTQKKVSPVRPHIGGKPVVTDSNGNIPMSPYSESSARRNVFANTSVSKYEEKSSNSVSVVQNPTLASSGLSKCFGIPDSPVNDLKTSRCLANSVCDLERGQSVGNSFPVVSVIDYSSNEFMCSNQTAVTSSCPSVGIITPVPDLVKSALGLDCFSNIGATSSMSNKSCLNVPIYQSQKRLKISSKKLLKGRRNVGDVQKSVPLAEVRPSLLYSTPIKTTESLINSVALPSLPSSLSHSELSSSVLWDEVAQSNSLLLPDCNIRVPPITVTGPTLNSSGSPPTLILFSPLSKPCVASNENLLLSPQMPILSPLAIPCLTSSTSSLSVFSHADSSHSIYSLANCNSGTGSVTGTKNSAKFFGSVPCPAFQLDDGVKSSSGEMMPMASTVLHDPTTDSVTLQSQNVEEINIDSNGSKSRIPKQDLFGEQSCSSDKVNHGVDPSVIKRSSTKQNSPMVNAFLVNSGFGKEVYKKSKLSFHAALAFDYEASTSESVRLHKDMILSTRYYKVIAPKFGFSVSTVKDMGEQPVLQSKISLKSACETDVVYSEQKNIKTSKIRASEECASLSKDVGLCSRQESASRTVGRKGKTGKAYVKNISLNNENSSTVVGVDATPVELNSAVKFTRLAKRRSLKEASNNSDNSELQNTLKMTSRSDTRRAQSLRDMVASNSSDLLCSSSLNDGSKGPLNIGCLGSEKKATTCSSKETKLTTRQKPSSDLMFPFRNKKAKSDLDKEHLVDVVKFEPQDIKVEVSDMPETLCTLPSNVLPKTNEKRKSIRLCTNDVDSESHKAVLDGNEMDTTASELFVKSRKAAVKGPVKSKTLESVEEIKSKRTRFSLEEKVSSSSNSTVAFGVVTKLEEKSQVTQEADVESRSQIEEKDAKVNISESAKKNSKHSSSILRELANSEGYVAEKHTPKRSDNLFIDSRFLTREERALQMALMRMTKMEVKEEWSKIKEKQECTAMTNSSQKKTKTKEFKKGKMQADQEQDGFLPSEKSVEPQKEKRKFVAQKSMSKSSILIPKDKTKLKQVTLKQTLDKKKKAGVTSALVSRRIQKMHEADCSSWINRTVRKHTKKSGGRFRFRWRSGIWKKKANSSPKSKKHTKNSKFLVKKKVFQSLNVDVIAPASSSQMSLSPCSGISSKLSPFLNSERSFTRDDDVVSLSSSVADSSINRRIIPLEVKKMVTCHATGETVLHRAARLGYNDVALWCCQTQYVDVNSKDFAGYTPLHETFLHSNVTIARYLIHYGADLNNAAERRGGTRPLHEAVECDSMEMVRLLLSAGADSNLTTYSGKTVQDVAQTATMKEFLNAYLADVNGGLETEWNFRPSWDVPSQGDATELGMDLLEDVPCDEDLDDQNVVFECLEEPLLPVYMLCLHKGYKPRRYVLLCDVLERLQLSREQFLLNFPDIVVEQISQEQLFAQFHALELIRDLKMSEIRMKCLEPSVDLLLMTSQLQSLLHIDVLWINSSPELH